MNTIAETIAISTGDHKMAALFFDKIWPLHSMDSVPDEIQDVNVSIPGEPDDVVMKTLSDWIMSVSKSPKDSVTFSARAAVLMKKLIENERYSEFLDSEFPHDNESLRKIRNLRVLFRDKYKEKDSEYIKDDIDKRIDEYEQACKKHGFELLQSGFSSLLDPKSLLGLSSLAVASSVIGGPAALTASAISGAVLHTSKLVVELVSSHWKFKRDQQNDEVAYIIEAKKQITGDI